MKLKNTARWADTTRLYDGYEPRRFVMLAQVSSYIDNQQDGAISKRRPISYAPELELPERRVVTYEGEVWIVGDTLVDMWKGKPIRRSAACKKATGLYSLLTPGKAALDEAGTKAFAQLVYLKDTISPMDTSAYSPQFEVSFSSVEEVTAKMVVKTDNGWLHVRSTYPVLDGFVCAVCDDLGPDARENVVIVSQGDYDAAADSRPTLNYPTTAIALDYYKLYGRDTAMTYNHQPGDMTLLVNACSVQVKVGDTVKMCGAWNVLGAIREQDAWRLHIRKVG